MSHVTLSRTCGCVIDNGDDGETFKMVYPCDLHTDPHDAIAEARAWTVAKETAKEAGKDGWTIRDDEGSMHVATLDVFSGVVVDVAASSAPLTLEAYQEAIEPINERREANGKGA